MALKALLFFVKEESLWRSAWKTEVPSRRGRGRLAKSASKFGGANSHMGGFYFARVRNFYGEVVFAKPYNFGCNFCFAP